MTLLGYFSYFDQHDLISFGSRKILIYKFDLSFFSFLSMIPENDEKCVHFTERMVEYAGLSNKVKIFHGSVSTSNGLFGPYGLGIKEILQKNHGSDSLDILFIDHDKVKYIDDLKIIESCGLLKSGKKEYYWRGFLQFFFF